MSQGIGKCDECAINYFLKFISLLSDSSQQEIELLIIIQAEQKLLSSRLIFYYIKSRQNRQYKMRFKMTVDTKLLKHLEFVFLLLNKLETIHQLNSTLYWLCQESSPGVYQNRIYIHNKIYPFIILLENNLFKSIQVKLAEGLHMVLLQFVNGIELINIFQKCINVQQDISIELKKQKPTTEGGDAYRFMNLNIGEISYQLAVKKPIQPEKSQQPTIIDEQWFNGIQNSKVSFNLLCEHLKNFVRMVMKSKSLQEIVDQSEKRYLDVVISFPDSNLQIMIKGPTINHSSKIKIDLLQQANLTNPQQKNKIYKFAVSISDLKLIYQALHSAQNQIRVIINENNEMAFCYEKEQLFTSHLRVSNCFKFISGGGCTKFQQ